MERLESVLLSKECGFESTSRAGPPDLQQILYIVSHYFYCQKSAFLLSGGRREVKNNL